MPRYQKLCSVCGLVLCGCLIITEFREALHPRAEQKRIVFMLPGWPSQTDHDHRESGRYVRFVLSGAMNVGSATSSGSVEVTPRTGTIRIGG